MNQRGLLTLAAITLAALAGGFGPRPAAAGQVLSVAGNGWSAEFPLGADAFRMRREPSPGESAASVTLRPASRNGRTGRISAATPADAPEGMHAAVELSVDFDGETGRALAVFAEDGLLTFSGRGGIETLALAGTAGYVFLPGFFLEDVLYDPATAGGAHLPPEQAAGALLEAGSAIFLAAWPGETQAAMVPPAETAALLEMPLAGTGEIHAVLLAANGIWHQVEIPADRLGSEEIALDWKPPFPAAWRTQLSWSGIETVFLFRDGIENSHRLGGRYPAWMNDGRAYVAPADIFFPSRQAATVIYPFDGHEESLLGFLRRTPLGEHFENIMKRSGPFSPPAGRSRPNVGFTACWGTGLIRRSIFSSGIQDREQPFLHRWIELVLGANEGTQRRRENYGRLTDRLEELIERQRSEAATPVPAAYLDTMAETAGRMQERFQQMVSADGRNSPAGYVAWAEKLAARLKEIITVPGDEYGAEYDAIVRRLNHITWAQQETTGGYRGGGYGHHWRDWFHRAAAEAAACPEAASFAALIRGEIRDFLKARSWETPGI